ncbi:MAG TPA: Gfo/Idh/MocA family oxidoreductase [Anaerolineae bacterium]|jgi:predicted dehydrogenase
MNSKDHALKSPIRVGIIGMGGFAASHHDAILQLEAEGKCSLVCTCDPAPEAWTDRVAALRFEQRHVKFFDNYLDMLTVCRDNLDLITIPTPVPFHAEMHRTCIECGLAVYLEKPPTLDYRELREMLMVEEAATHETNVGFNFIIESDRRLLKQRLLNGDFGQLRRVSFTGLWPRPHSYFGRAPWVARLILNDRLVLDSCFGNAMAHYVHNVLFWAGMQSLNSWATIKNVIAELYRANQIEGPDTFFVQAHTSDDVLLNLALTHACDGDHRHYERLECDNATITYRTFDRYTIDWKDGSTESHTIPPVSLTDNLRTYLDFLVDPLPPNRPATRLVDSVPFVDLNNLAYVSAGQIQTIPPNERTTARIADKTSLITSINNIDRVFARFLHEGLFPSAQNLTWGIKSMPVTLNEMPRLHEVVTNMKSSLGAH